MFMLEKNALDINKYIKLGPTTCFSPKFLNSPLTIHMTIKIKVDIPMIKLPRGKTDFTSLRKYSLYASIISGLFGMSHFE
jgi:hypothetical protein